MSTQAQAGAPEKQLVIQKIYLKDASFESPSTPDVFTKSWQPEVSVEVNTGNKRIAEDVFEVQVSITVTAKLGEKTAFLTEIHQCGIFTVKGFEDQELVGILGSYCPNILFPYAREAISDFVGKGGFPQLLLAPVNFDALLAQHLERQRMAQETKVH